MEELKGKAKRAVGSATGTRSLEREGKAQEKKSQHSARASEERDKAKAAKTEEKAANRRR